MDYSPLWCLIKCCFCSRSSIYKRREAMRPASLHNMAVNFTLWNIIAEHWRRVELPGTGFGNVMSHSNSQVSFTIISLQVSYFSFLSRNRSLYHKFNNSRVKLFPPIKWLSALNFRSGNYGWNLLTILASYFSHKKQFMDNSIVLVKTYREE